MTDPLPPTYTDAEYYEALSRKYAEAVCFILKLETGRYALFNGSRQLLVIDTLEEICKHPQVTTYVYLPAPKKKEEIDLDYLTDL